MTALLLITVVLLVAVDQLTKVIMRVWLQPLQSVELIPHFIRFRYVLNTGAAFSMLENARWLFIAVTVIFTAACLAALCSKKLQNKYPILKSNFLKCTLVLISAGGIGNLIDRIFVGKVVDFIEPVFVNFAVFNFADMLVTVGAFMLAGYLIFDIIRDSKKKRTKNE